MKSKRTFIILTLFSIVPINRYYLGRTSIWRTVTLNWFCVGWFMDLLHPGAVFDKEMAKRGYTQPMK